MKEKISALHSKYIIDGVSRRLTPAEMLDDCLARREGNQTCGEGGFEPVVDESTDPTPSLKVFGTKDIQEYLSKVVSLIGEPRPFPAAYPEPYTKGQIAKALLDAIWLKGHFKLNDLTIAAKWRWNRRPLGNMAAFYASAEATADYVDGLGICLSGYSFTESPRLCQASFKVGAAEKDEDPEDDDENIFIPGDAPFGSEHPVIGRRRAVPDKLQDESGSWIIYVPFDTCGFRLGNSLLCDALGQNGDKYPEVGDADYFIDCRGGSRPALRRHSLRRRPAYGIEIDVFREHWSRHRHQRHHERLRRDQKRPGPVLGSSGSDHPDKGFRL